MAEYKEPKRTPVPTPRQSILSKQRSAECMFETKVDESRNRLDSTIIEGLKKSCALRNTSNHAQSKPPHVFPKPSNFCTNSFNKQNEIYRGYGPPVSVFIDNTCFEESIKIREPCEILNGSGDAQCSTRSNVNSSANPLQPSDYAFAMYSSSVDFTSPRISALQKTDSIGTITGSQCSNMKMVPAAEQELRSSLMSTNSDRMSLNLIDLNGTDDAVHISSENLDVNLNESPYATVNFDELFIEAPPSGDEEEYLHSKIYQGDSIWNSRYISPVEYWKMMNYSAMNTAYPTKPSRCKYVAKECVDADVTLSASPLPPTRLQPQPRAKEFMLSSAESCTIVQLHQPVVDGELICYSGWVKLTLNKKDRGRHWAVLKNSQLVFYDSEDEGNSIYMGPYLRSNFVYVGKVPSNGHILNLYIKQENSPNDSIHIKMQVDSSAQHWICHLAKCFMPRDEMLLYSIQHLDAGGNLWIRQGASCAWSKGWLHIGGRQLFYVLNNCTALFELDIRKILSIKATDVAKVDWCAFVRGSQRGPFLLLQNGGSLYIQAEFDSATSLWVELILSAMDFKGYQLEDQKLTADDVPIVVDKCVKYISTYGLCQKGLYRCNGSNVEARLLLQDFRKDPADVYIVPETDDMVNIVADVLRTFFRELDSPLLPYEAQEKLLTVAQIKDQNRFDAYYEIINSLSRVRRQTIRRLLDHFKDVTERAYANLASVENIAKVFAPTLFSVDSYKGADEFGEMTAQMLVLKDLILNFTTIFRIPLHEMYARTKMDMLFDKASAAKVPASGFLVPVHLLERDNHTFNVQSSCTAEQICEAARNRPILCQKNCSDFALFEVIKAAQLERRVAWNETMNPMVTRRWLDWDPTDCYLLYKNDPIPFLHDVSYPFANGLKMAEPGSKSYSTAHLKLESGTKLLHFNKVMKKVNEWDTVDLIWFIGHETARKPPFPYTLTFVKPCKNFKYKSKFIGYCVAFTENHPRIQWLNAVLSSLPDFKDKPEYPLVSV